VNRTLRFRLSDTIPLYHKRPGIWNCPCEDHLRNRRNTILIREEPCATLCRLLALIHVGYGHGRDTRHNPTPRWVLDLDRIGWLKWPHKPHKPLTIHKHHQQLHTKKMDHSRGTSPSLERSEAFDDDSSDDETVDPVHRDAYEAKMAAWVCCPSSFLNRTF